MKWKDKFTLQISSRKIAPKVGMLVELLKPIDGNNELVGKTGKIVKIDYTIKINWNVPENTCGTYKNTYDGVTYYNIWNGNKTEWNKGCFKIIKNPGEEL